MTQIPVDWGGHEQFRMAIQMTIDGEKAVDSNQQTKDNHETNPCIAEPDRTVRLRPSLTTRTVGHT